MTAPGYSRHRIALAHRVGLGTQRVSYGKDAAAPEEAAKPEIPVLQVPARRRGRPAKK